MQTDPIQISNVNIYLLKHKQPGKLTFKGTKPVDNSLLDLQHKQTTDIKNITHIRRLHNKKLYIIF